MFTFTTYTKENMSQTILYHQIDSETKIEKLKYFDLPLTNSCGRPWLIIETRNH